MPPYPIHEHRKAREAVYLNGFLWGIGSGLVSTAMITYMIRDICSVNSALPVGTAIAWIIAAPRVMGLFRLLIPWTLEKFGSKKRLTVCAFVLSPLILLAIPLGMQTVMNRFSTGFAIVYLGLIWAFYHIVEYFGSVTLWAWIGDLTPQKIRGRVFAVRDRMIVLGQLIGWGVIGFYSFQMIEPLPNPHLKWSGYFPPTICGIICLMCSAVPIIRTPEILPIRKSSGIGKRLAEIIAPLKLPGFVRFLIFGILLQISLGFTQSVQYNYHLYTIGITLLISNWLHATTRIGQVVLSPTMGRLIDRFGAFWVMSLSIVMVSSGSLFYFFAGSASWGLLFGAAIVWIFWVGINIGISGAVLNLSQPEHKTSGVAFYATATTLAFAVSAMLGGILHDCYKGVTVFIPFIQTTLTYAQICFLGCFTLRLLLIFVLAWAMSPKLRTM